MLSAPLSKLTARGYARFDLHETQPRALDQAEHDLVLRYAIVGIFLILLIASLQLTRIISLPIVAGVVFGLVFGPVVDWMVRRNVPQHLAAALVVLAGCLGGLLALALLTAPIALYSDQLPAMAGALQRKLADMFAVIRRLEATADSIANSGAKLNVSDGSPLLSIAVSSSTAFGGLLMFIFTIYFYLASRRHLKARVLRLCLGQDARKSAGEFFEEIESRVATYLWVVTVVNIGVGLIAMALAWLAGLPYPIFWGALAFFLNYLAFIGPIIVSVLMFAAGLVANATLFDAIWPAAIFYIAHLFEGNWVTPTLVGNRLTVSPFLVFLSFIFWLWLWGPIGAVLSTPLLLVIMAAQESYAKYRDVRIETLEAAAPGA